jgi:hypothetical protein
VREGLAYCKGNWVSNVKINMTTSVTASIYTKSGF